ncbi:MAG: metalloregulator ArsR/SmtB family transcription factor [bacterium]|nr:metalloregulator ArsR/SmtB family transcription factor [bacterium]
MLDTSQIIKIRKTITEEDTTLSSLFNVLGDKNRFRILKMLIQNGELCVSDIAAILDVSISSVSQHLRILEMSGLVMGERMGQMICYKPLIENPRIKAIINLI